MSKQTVRPMRDFGRKSAVNSCWYKNFIDFQANAASPIPRVSLDKFLSDYQHIQAFPADRTPALTAAAMEKLRGKLAGQINCLAKAVAVMRNTTEALNNAIMGMPLNRGDEVIASIHEYDSMLGSFYQRKVRDGIVVKQIEIPYRIESTEEVLRLW